MHLTKDATLPSMMSGPRHWVPSEAVAYWDHIRGDRDVPTRADIDPADIPKLLPHLVLLDVFHEPRDFRYRLVGTTVEEFMNKYYTGVRMSELPHQRPPSQIWKSCCTVVGSRRPLFSAVPYVGPKKEFVRAEDVILPLAPPNEAVNMLLVAVGYIRKHDNKPV